MAFKRKPKKQFKKKRKQFFSRISKALPNAPVTMVFKRTTMEALDLSAKPTSNPVAGFNNLYAESTSGTINNSFTSSPIFTLGDVTAYSDFQNLFTHYKICGVSERFFLSNNPATAPQVRADGEPGASITAGGTSGEANYYNPSILMDSWYNPIEVTGPAVTNDVLQIQRRKRRILNVKGKKMYTKVKQLVQVENKAGNLDINTLALKNKWIPMEHVDVPHYGLTHWIRASTGTPYMPGVVARIERTYYIACRAVR